jgi:hypothetical protein
MTRWLIVTTEKIGAELDSEGPVSAHDASTNGLINAFKEKLAPSPESSA